MLIESSLINLSAKMSRSVESMLGLLKIRVKRGINLAVRDALSSDPYVVITMGKQACNFLFVFAQNQFNFVNMAREI